MTIYLIILSVGFFRNVFKISTEIKTIEMIKYLELSSDVVDGKSLKFLI